MTKIHPNSPSIELSPPSPSQSFAVNDETVEVMTVWRKSLLFNCKGFTVFDAKGNLVFRVDNYSTNSKSHILLMDATGSPLFTVRRKRLSIGENWLIYEGEDRDNALFSAVKHVTLRPSKRLARVTPCDSKRRQWFSVEGSYSQRSCAVYDEKQRRVVAEVLRKEAAPGVELGGDVFRLVVRSGIDSRLAMAIVVLLDQMYGC